MASTYLTRTPSTAGNRKTWTYSAWFKISDISTSAKRLFTSYDGSTASNQSTISLGGGSAYALQIYNAPSGSASINLITNRLFKDVFAWYHIVVAVDTTQATGSNRVKLYVNGVQETSFSTETYGSQNEDFFINSTNLHTIGRRQDNSQYFDGSMSHVHFIDGTAYDASAFGETDTTTGEWKAKTSPSVTYGTNGFFILKDGNGITDQSGEGNDFTLGGGTLTNLKDNPDNTFATLNALDNTSQTLSNGNTSGYGVTNKAYRTTLGFQGGKYYWEAKCVTQNTYTMIVGLINETNISNGSYASGNIGTNANGWAYFMQSNQDNGKSWHNNTLGSTYQTISQGDILQIAVDGDAGKIWWGVNGTWVNSGNPANGTNAVFTNVSTDQILFPSYSAYNGSGGNPLISFNFGNGYFGTTAVSSAGTNASGNGIFEYDVPTGYTALSTKGLNL